MRINGTELAVFRQGRGEPILLVHGSSSDHRTWDMQLAEFSKNYECIAYSRRYHRPNKSIESGTDYSMTEQTDDLEALIRMLDVGPVHLVSHSYGALLGLFVAGRAPSLLRTMVLVEAPAINLFAHDPPKPAEIVRLMLTRPRLGLEFMKFGIKTAEPAVKAARRGDFRTADRIFGEGVLGAETFAALSEARAKQAEENSFPEELLGSGFVKLDPNVLRKTSVPTLVVSGNKSPRLWSLIADEIAAQLPIAERVTIQDASHIVHEDNSTAFNKAVLEFVSARSRS